MKPKRGLLTGPKMTHNHSTVTSESCRVIAAAKKCPHVTKIVLGPIASLGPAKARLSFAPVQAGLKIAVRGNGSHQVLYVYTDNLSETQEYLTMEFQK